MWANRKKSRSEACVKRILVSSCECFGRYYASRVPNLSVISRIGAFIHFFLLTIWLTLLVRDSTEDINIIGRDLAKRLKCSKSPKQSCHCRCWRESGTQQMPPQVCMYAVVWHSHQICYTSCQLQYTSKLCRATLNTRTPVDVILTHSV